MRFRKGRPKIPRIISEEPKARIFKPEDILDNKEIDVLNLSFEELESIRLVDYLGYSHEEAANAMGVSRRVFWNILKSARKKVSDFLVKIDFFAIILFLKVDSLKFKYQFRYFSFD